MSTARAEAEYVTADLENAKALLAADARAKGLASPTEWTKWVAKNALTLQLEVPADQLEFPRAPVVAQEHVAAPAGSVPAPAADEPPAPFLQPVIKTPEARFARPFVDPATAALLATQPLLITDFTTPTPNADAGFENDAYDAIVLTAERDSAMWQLEKLKCVAHLEKKTV